MKTRMALRHSGDPNSIVAFMKIFHSQGGFKSFYRGYTISMLSYVPYAGMELSLFEVSSYRLSLYIPTIYTRFQLKAL